MKTIVTRNDWSVVDMPGAYTETSLNRNLSDAEYQALQRGFRPRDMDDRWFMYVHEGWLYLHRSWTGFCIFMVKLEFFESNYALTLLRINRDLDQYKSTNAETDKDELNSVLSNLITLNLKIEIR